MRTVIARSVLLLLCYVIMLQCVELNKAAIKEVEQLLTLCMLGASVTLQAMVSVAVTATSLCRQ